MRLLPTLCVLLLTGCGVSETATVAATVGAAKAKESEQAKTAPAQVQEKLDQSFRQAEQRREEADVR